MGNQAYISVDRVTFNQNKADETLSKTTHIHIYITCEGIKKWPLY
jgi:hypothetical protein